MINKMVVARFLSGCFVQLVSNSKLNLSNHSLFKLSVTRVTVYNYIMKLIVLS